MLNFLEVKELRSYRSRWSLGVNSLTTNYYPYLLKLNYIYILYKGGSEHIKN